MPTPTFDNRNENRINIKTDSTVKLIRELSKLGVFKSKKRPKKRRADTDMDGIKQESDMVGYTKSLGGPQMRNLPPIQQIQAGMSQSQIEDIQRRNDAVVAALRGEVQQQRLEDIEAQQGQRFADITKLGGIMNPLLERFRGSTFPAQAMGDQPIDPFSSRRGGAILLGNSPDIQEERFTQTLNEGGPPATEKLQTTQFAQPEKEVLSEEEEVVSEEELPIGVALAEKTGGGSAVSKQEEKQEEKRKANRTEILAQRGLGPLPALAPEIDTDVMRAYYIRFVDAFQEEYDPTIVNNKKKMYDLMKKIADTEVPLSN
jgi:hypothetical protein